MPPTIKRILEFSFLAASVLLLSSAAAEACSCASYDTPAACELYKKVDVAFVGKAIHVPPDRAGGKVRFQLTQPIKGVAGREVSVMNDESGMGCGYQFEEGATYLVFAGRDADGTIDIGPCTSTVWDLNPPDWSYPGYKRDSANAKAFAESMRKPASGGRIFGDVWIDRRFSEQFNGQDGEKPVDGATVTLQGADDVRRTTTVNGRYEFTGLPRGSYRVSVTMPGGLPQLKSARPPQALVDARSFLADSTREYTRSITVEDARSCGYAPFEGAYEGDVTGSIVRDDGSPAARMIVEIVPEHVDPHQNRDFSGPTVETDERGVFRFERLPPGRYVVGVNLRDDLRDIRRTVYRQQGDDASPIVELGINGQLDLGVLRLSAPNAKRVVAGMVKWSDDRALGKVRVVVYEDRPDIQSYERGEAKMDGRGGFSIDMFEGRTYIVKAEAAGPRGWYDREREQDIPPIAESASITIKLESNRTNLLLVIEPRQGGGLLEPQVRWYRSRPD